MADNAAAVETVQSMQQVVGEPVVALAQTQKLDYIENVDQSSTLVGILYGIKANQEVLQRIEQNLTTQQSQAIEEQTDLQQEQIRQSADVAGETALESPAGGEGLFTDAFKDKIGTLKDLMGKAGTGIKSFGSSIGGLFGPKGILLALGATFFALKDQLPMVTESIKSIVIAFRDKILPPLKNLWENVLKPFITTFVEGIGKTLPTIFEGIGSIIDGLISIFQGDFTEGFKSLFGGAGKILKGATDFILNFFGTSTDEIGASIKQFFTDILDGIKAPFIAVYDFIKPGGTGDQMLAEYIYEPIENFIENVKTFFTDLWDGAVQAVKDTFAGIGNFFSNIVDNVKTAINGAIDSIDILPDFVKEKLKFETKASKEAGERITETGVKGKYVDQSITGMERERMTGGGATMEEGFAEAKGEKYGTAKITKSGTSGYDFAAGVLTPKQMTEFNKLKTTDEQLQYLKNLDDEEQKRREMIMKLRDDKIAFDKKNADYIKKYKVNEKEFMSPDDQLLQDDIAYRNNQRQKVAAMKPEDTGGTGTINQVISPNTANNTVVNNSQNVSTVKLDTGVDPYAEKLANAFG
jgi:hypothetical protein